MSSTLTRPGTRLRRAAAGAITTALAATSLALVPGSAQAAPIAAPTLTWKISQQFVDHLTTRTLTDGATFDADAGFTFVDGEGTFNPNSGVTEMAYEGSVKGAFAMNGNEFYSVTVADPIVAVDAAGEGTITAEVSAANAAQGPNPAASTSPTRVVVTTFDAAVTDWTAANGLQTLTDTPDWADVLATGSPEALALGLSASQPVDGKSFAPAFLGQLTPGVRAHFYDSGTGSSNPKKNPAQFAATALGARIASTNITEQTPTSLKVAVSGAGYKAGGVGIYVSIGETGATSVTDAGQYLGTVWTGNPGNPASKVQDDGTFTTTLNLDAAAIAKLDPTKDYSVITMKAHGQAATDASQTASTPVEIDFQALGLKFSSKPVVSVASSKVYGKTATVTATVPTLKGVAPTGKITMTGAGTQAKTLAGGKATFSVPANLAVGKRGLTVAYAGDANYNASSSAAAITVSKDSVTIADKVTKKPTTKKSGKVTITVKAKSSNIKPTGKVTVYFKKKGQKSVKTSTGSLKNGVKSLTVPKLKKKGAWKIYVKYAAGSGYNSVSSKYVGTVKVTK